jgi:hypothetical protein
MHVDPTKAWQYTKEIVAIGPRWDGSPGQQKMGEYIHNRLKNDDVEEDRFVADTPEGKINMRNIVAKFPGTKDGVIVIGSHIDTNYPLRKINFVGANDGACTTALLLAFADLLRGKKLEGRNRQSLRQQASGPEMEAGWHVQEDQSVHSCRHDRRCRPRYYAGPEFNSLVARRSSESGDQPGLSIVFF